MTPTMYTTTPPNMDRSSSPAISSPTVSNLVITQPSAPFPILAITAFAVHPTPSLLFKFILSNLTLINSHCTYV
uniref:Uncharacterized protein n=1 Tax=Moniliophthora roreri TaxID=221103 RepID=A0A0W0F9Q5_MONRR